MAEILPFIGMRYNSQLIGNLSKVVAPPYDLISPELQSELHERHPNNAVRLELGKDDSEEESDGFSNRYTRAANTLGTWRSDGILIEDERPSVYLYEQEFTVRDGSRIKRRGFIALAKLEEFKSGRVRPHAQTFSGPKADRLKLMRATHANFSAIFMAYEDPEHKVQELLASKMADRAWEEVTDDDGTVHRLWVVQKKDFLIELRELMKEKELLIADGHHRYETALAYRDEQRANGGKADGKQPFDYVMMYMTELEQDGLLCLPTHRAMSREFVKEVDLKEAMEELKENFDLQKEQVDLENTDSEASRVLGKLAELGNKRPAIAMVLGNGSGFYLSLQENVDPVDLIDDEEVPDEVKGIDVTILHHHIINYVMMGNPEFELEEGDCLYLKDATKALELLKMKKAALVFLLNPIPHKKLITILKAGLRLPHKSTYFYPKLVTGLVVRRMDGENKKPAKTSKAAKR